MKISPISFTFKNLKNERFEAENVYDGNLKPESFKNHAQEKSRNPFVQTKPEALRANFLPLNFTSNKRVQRKNVPIARFDGSVRCPCCGDKMQNFNKQEARKFATIISMKNGEDLAESLKKNAGIFQANKRNLIREIARLAPRYPNEKLSGLLGILSSKYTDTLRMKQIIIAMQIPREIDNLTSENEAAIKEWQIGQIQRIISASEEGEFRNKHLVTSFLNFAKEKGIKIDEDKIRNYFNKLPSSKKDAEAFVVKYQRRSSREAAYKLIKNTEPTIEHIIPFSESGNNRIENLLVMCSDCNTIRGNMSYDDFIAQNPEMLQNIDKYFADINRLLRSQKSQMSPEDREKYKTYVKDVQKTLENYSPEYFDFKHKH